VVSVVAVLAFLFTAVVGGCQMQACRRAHPGAAALACFGN
jgi:hypothetical protein